MTEWRYRLRQCIGQVLIKCERMALCRHPTRYHSVMQDGHPADKVGGDPDVPRIHVS
jgi:hypothetical protein